jgi:hypothetical protein
MYEHDGHLPIKCYVSFVLDIYASPCSKTSGRALDYHAAVDSFVTRNKELHPFELSAEDWNSITLVSSWLKSFRSATTQMSATKTPMLSTTHAIFRGLQDDIKTILRSLPSTVGPAVKKGLTDAHRKLSDYYNKYDESPFYTWAARKWRYHDVPLSPALIGDYQRRVATVCCSSRSPDFV